MIRHWGLCLMNYHCEILQSLIFAGLQYYSPNCQQQEWSLKSILAAGISFTAYEHFSVSPEWYQLKLGSHDSGDLVNSANTVLITKPLDCVSSAGMLFRDHFSIHGQWTFFSVLHGTVTNYGASAW